MKIFDGNVATLVKHGQRIAVTVEGDVKNFGGAGHAIDVGQLDRWHLRQHVDDGTRRRAAEPIVGNFPLVECVKQAEGIVDVGHVLAEMIAIVHSLQFYECLVATFTQLLRQPFDIRVQLSGEFFLGDAAECLVVGGHRDVVEVVERAEDAHLRELGDAGDEDELQVVVEGLEWTEEG